MAAAQQAHKQAPKATQKTPQKPLQDAPQKRGDIKEALYNLPVAAGVAIMALLLVVSLFVGNFRALQKVTPKDFIRQGDVKSIIEDRIDAANNVMTVASRVGLDGTQAVDNAINALEKAKSAREISRADQQLTAAVSRLTTAQLSGEEARNMLRAADDFAEMGSFLRQEARSFNEKAEKAEKLYDKLPTKFLLAEPDMYEGV